jgi:Fe2+ transport system protein B
MLQFDIYGWRQVDMTFWQRLYSFLEKALYVAMAMAIWNHLTGTEKDHEEKNVSPYL